jgi:hypothetical protein
MLGKERMSLNKGGLSIEIGRGDIGKNIRQAFAITDYMG